MDSSERISRFTRISLANYLRSGVLPALGLVVIAYAAASFSVMVFSMFLAEGNTPNTIHLVLQVCLGGTAGILCAFFSLARGAASSGLSPLPPGVSSPPMLASHIEEQEQRFKDMSTGTEAVPVAAELRALRETIKYSLFRVGSIGLNDRYQTFSGKVLDLCSALASIGSLRRESIGAEVDTIRSLRLEAKTIADDLKR